MDLPSQLCRDQRQHHTDSLLITGQSVISPACWHHKYSYLAKPIVTLSLENLLFIL